jgi:hypothetical protein
MCILERERDREIRKDALLAYAERDIRERFYTQIFQIQNYWIPKKSPTPPQGDEGNCSSSKTVLLHQFHI